MSRAHEQDITGPAERPPRAVQDSEVDLKALGGIPIQCQFCVGRSFRRSRLRSSDLPQMLLLRYPVRCRRCSQRQMVRFTVAGVSVPSHVRHMIRFRRRLPARSPLIRRSRRRCSRRRPRLPAGGAG